MTFSVSRLSSASDPACCPPAPIPAPSCILWRRSPALDDMLAPEELSAWVLQHLRRRAEEQLGEEVAGAVRGSRSAARLPADALLLALPAGRS